MVVAEERPGYVLAHLRADAESVLQPVKALGALFGHVVVRLAHHL
jgi:hypothetical protein